MSLPSPTPQTTALAQRLDMERSRLLVRTSYESMMILAGRFERENIELRGKLAALTFEEARAEELSGNPMP